MRNKMICLFLAVVFACSGCEEWISENSSSIYDDAHTFTSREDTYAALYGGYSRLKSEYLYGRRVSRFMSDENSDLIRAISPNVWNKATWGVTKGEFYTWWIGNYQLIGTANNFIRKISDVADSDIGPEEKRELKAEMKFLRAIGYLNLVMAYGRVPLLTHQPEDLDEVTYPTRSSLEDLYALMISDLREAESYLPMALLPGQQDGRATRGAAAALLAKVYMTKATSEAAEESDYSNAVVLLDDLIAGNYGAYDLCPDLADIYDPDKEGNQEHVFSIKYDTPPGVSSNIVLAYSPKSLYPAQSVAVPIAANSFVQTFDQQNDKRFQYGLIQKHPETGEFLHKNKYYFVYKFQDDQKTQAGADRCDFLYLRYADVLLMHSEALHLGHISLSPHGLDKYYGINKVRARARIANTGILADLADGNYTEDFLDLILQERAWEFFAEGKRRWDLLRTGRYLTKMAEYYQSEGIAGGNTDLIRVLFPLPYLEIETNPNLIPAGETNNGYVMTGEGDTDE